MDQAEMQPKSFLLDKALFDYLLAHGAAPDDVQMSLIERTATLGGVAAMQVSPEQGVFLTMLTQIAGTRRAVEVGTFTGYSALCIAKGLGEGGSLLCCDVSEEWTAIGREHWEAAGVADRIELRIGPAIDTLRALPDTTEFDIAFVDADKGGYLAYYEELVPRMRPGGIILVDNVLWGGSVVQDSAEGDEVKAIHAFNDHVSVDPRVQSLILPIADGITLIRTHT